MKPKYIPLEKRSKQEQKEYHARQRRGWGEISPVTRKTVNKKAYNRKKSIKSERWSRHEPSFGFFIALGPVPNTYSIILYYEAPQ